MDLGTRVLVASAVGAVNTLNAWRPLRRTGRASALTFFPGWLTSELPLHTIGWQAAATAAVGAAGGFRGRPGKLGLAVSLASWAGLAAIHREGQRAKEVLEDALAAELGTDYRKRRTRCEPDADEDVAIKRKQIALVGRGRTRRYTAARNVAYGELGRRNQLDVLHRTDLPAGAKAPVLLHVHGGAWVMGDKQQQGGPLLGRMSERGWVCVTINYRLSPRATWPDHIIDVKRAIAWTKEHIADHGGDPSFIAITGGSAGGHLSSLAALTPNVPAFQPGFEDLDTAVQAAVPLYGVYDWTNRDGSGRADLEDFLARVVLKTELAEDRVRWEEASSMSWINDLAPPFFVIHGTNDSLAPHEQARSFVARLRDVSANPVVYAELPRAQHAFEVFGSVRAHHTVRAIERFLEVVRSEA